MYVGESRVLRRAFKHHSGGSDSALNAIRKLYSNKYVTKMITQMPYGPINHTWIQSGVTMKTTNIIRLHDVSECII